MVSKTLTPGRAEGTITWSAVKKGLEAVSGATVEVGCNFDASGKRQLYEVNQTLNPIP
jgi:hypothetical protein